MLRARGTREVMITTPRFDDRSFGTSMMEAALAAHAGKGRPLSDAELNQWIDELDLRPTRSGWPGRTRSSFEHITP